jgi:hypothetical protein
MNPISTAHRFPHAAFSKEKLQKKATQKEPHSPKNKEHKKQ